MRVKAVFRFLISSVYAPRRLGPSLGSSRWSRFGFGGLLVGGFTFFLRRMRCDDKVSGVT